MKNQIASLIGNCPPYLLFISAFASVVALGCFKLLGLLQSVQAGL